MQTKEDHLAYRQSMGPFHIDCYSGQFTQEEKDLLTQWGNWIAGLLNKDLEQITESQTKFVQSMQTLKTKSSDELAPHLKTLTNKLEFAYVKYMFRKKYEIEHPERAFRSFYGVMTISIRFIPRNQPNY